MQIESVNDTKIDGDKPYKTSHSIENTAYRTLLSRKACQLTINTIEDVCPHQQKYTDEVYQKTCDTIVVKGCLGKEISTYDTNNHRPDGDGIGVNVKLSKQTSYLIA